VSKHCFFDPARPCDLTCKAAFEVDDPVDNVDCHFIWLAYHLGEGVIEFKRVIEGLGGLGGFGGPAPGGGPGPFGGFGGGSGPEGPPKKGKGFPTN